MLLRIKKYWLMGLPVAPCPQIPSLVDYLAHPSKFDCIFHLISVPGTYLHHAKYHECPGVSEININLN